VPAACWHPMLRARGDHLACLVQVLHEAMVFLKVEFANQPSVDETERMKVDLLAPGVWRLVLHYGFKEHPDVPAAVARMCTEHAVPADPSLASYFLSRHVVATRENLSTSSPSGVISLASKWLFAVMHRNARGAVDFYRIPRADAIELGADVLI
jgi:KUP system potassium uptake protein